VKPYERNLEIEAARALARYTVQRAGDVEEGRDERIEKSVQQLGELLGQLRATCKANEECRASLAQVRDSLAIQRTAIQKMFDLSPDGVLSTDRAGLVRRVNLTAAEMLGMTPIHLVGKPIAVFVGLDERSAFRRMLHAIGDKGIFTFEGKLVARGGREFDASIRVNAHPDALHWTIRDVSEERGAQRRLAAANADLSDRTLSLESEVRSHREARESLAGSQQRYRMLSDHLQACIEDERARIARDLHDDLGAALTAIRFELSGTHHPDAVGETIRRALERVDAAIQSTRRICSDLRPSLLDHMGLWPAIEWYVEDAARRGGLQYEVDLAPTVELQEPVRTSVFRIVQEAVTNVLRHAGATSLRVSAREVAGNIQIEVADDGRGIRESELVRPDAFGVAGMQERARACGASIVIEPASRETQEIRGTRGTRVRLLLPIAVEATCES